MKSSENKVPRHLGIILDGNRRFSKRLMLKPWKGHEWGAKKVEKLLDWCKGYGIHEITLYAFSIENFDRPKKEFDFLMEIFKNEFTRMMDDPRLDNDDVRINFIGRIDMFPKDLQEIMNKLMEKTASHKKSVVNFAMAYGGRAEIIDAARSISKRVKEGKLKVEDIDEKTFSENLYIKSEPDLIIRTSESRLSGFLLWQGSYAEIIFLPDKLWPEFDKKDLDYCLNEYAKRKRRFGK